MTPQGWASRLPAALLLLWVPGCLSLSGPRHVTGTVGGSLSVQCRYEKKYRDHNKYWCKYPYLLPLRKIVETTKLKREVRLGHVSIRDHPANLTFTVTLESLTEGDGGTYCCGIDLSWHEGFRDIFKVEVSVSPAAPTSTPTTTTTTSTSTTTATTSTVTAQIPTVSAARTANATQSGNSQDGSRPSPDQDRGLPVLLILLALLLLLLAGASLLAWRMVRRRRRVKAGGNPEPLQNPCQAALQREPCYANLELQTLLQGEPMHPRQEEVEYSTEASREDLHYSVVVFTEDQRPSQRRPRPGPEYSAVRETRPEPEYSAIGETRPEPEYSAIGETRPEPEYSAVRETRPGPEYSAVREMRPEPGYSAIGETRPEPEYSAIGEMQPEPGYSAVVRETRPEPEYSAVVRETRPEPEYSAIGET